MSTKRKRRIKYLVFTLTPVIMIALIALVASMSMGPSTVSSAVAVDAPPCNTCHNNTTLLVGKQTQWEESGHGSGTIFMEEGDSKSCAGCHSGGGFSGMVAAGKEPNTLTAGDPEPTRQDCRTCHQTHNTFTGADWALETVAAVNLYALPGNTFDGGEGNLCAKCHQPRKAVPAAANGVVTIGTASSPTSRFGPHHGPQSSMMLGTGGAGSAAAGTSAAHYQYVENTCVGCHMGSTDNHTNEPNIATCKTCHTGATTFDIGGVQTDTQAKLDQLQGLLVTAGALDCTDPAACVPSASPLTQPENVAYGLWNWILIGNEDGSKGVHNPEYTAALLDTSIAALQVP